MWKRKAVLIQDIVEYIWIIKEALKPVLVDYHEHAGVTIDDAVSWIINEEIETIYNIFPRGHRREHGLYSNIHAAVRDKLPIPLNLYTSHYVKVPVLYGDNNEIEVAVRGTDLYIFYYAYNFHSMNPYIKPT